MTRDTHNFLRRSRTRVRGFTLIEAALTMSIVGIGLVSMLQLLAAGTAANFDGNETTTAVNLAKCVREQTLKMTFADVLTLDGAVHQPPVDSRGIEIAGFDDWRQAIDVQPINRDNLPLEILDANPQGVRVVVAITHNGRNVCDLSWHRFKPMP